MKINIARKILEILENEEREDLAEEFKQLFLENEDYKPPLRVKEPVEEFSEADCIKESHKVGVSPDGFFYLKD